MSLFSFCDYSSKSIASMVGMCKTEELNCFFPPFSFYTISIVYQMLAFSIATKWWRKSICLDLGASVKSGWRLQMERHEFYLGCIIVKWTKIISVFIVLWLSFSPSVSLSHTRIQFFFVSFSCSFFVVSVLRLLCVCSDDKKKQK